MRAGSLDRVVLIERATDTLDDFRVPVTTWSTLATVRARLVDQSTTEATRAEGSVTKRAVTVETRHLADVLPGDRLTLDGLAYLIADVREIGRRRGLTITAERTGR
jgi:SPP1 family predicted phage head-tail adaptor